MNGLANPRQIALLVLREIQENNILADVALDQGLRQANLSGLDMGLATELVYGCVRRQRSLDALIDILAKKPASEQPPGIRPILHLGLYQLTYLDHIPMSAAVHTTVELTKINGLGKLSGFVNGLLREYIRIEPIDIRRLLTENITNFAEELGIIYSYPNWIIELWLEQLGLEETRELCRWYNESPSIDLRINPLKTSLIEVETTLQDQGIRVTRIANLPQALRLDNSIGNITKIPGFDQGWWSVQDSSAQLVTHLLDPQPGEVIVDLCAAPGGKTTHIAELMGDNGVVWACDKTDSRLKRLRENQARLQLKSIQIYTGDSRNFDQLDAKCDRVLLDAPCSGLGTLHRRADARWRHNPAQIKALAKLQGELLETSANLVKNGGILVYATCTLNPVENEEIINNFLRKNPRWKIDKIDGNLGVIPTDEGWLKVWPHRQQMDGFFMVRLKLE